MRSGFKSCGWKCIIIIKILVSVWYTHQQCSLLLWPPSFLRNPKYNKICLRNPDMSALLASCKNIGISPSNPEFKLNFLNIRLRCRDMVYNLAPLSRHRLRGQEWNLCCNFSWKSPEGIRVGHRKTTKNEFEKTLSF